MAYNVGSFFAESYSKVTASKWTKLFVLVSVIQLFAIVALETNVLIRNVGFRKTLQPYEKYFEQIEPEGDSCELKPSIDRMLLIAQENVIFMMFQLFQLWFCINAICDENTIQIITLTVINCLCALYGIVQIFEIRKWFSDLKVACSGRSFSLEPAYTTHDVPLVTCLIAFALVMALICFKLYLEFGWNIYKKIGADVKIQKIFKTTLIFIMFIKLSLFFVLISAIEVFLAFSEDMDDSDLVEFTFTIPRNLYYLHLVVTILILILVNLGYQSLKREWKIGMVIYLTLSTIAIVDFVLILKASLRDVAGDWYFFIAFIAVSILVSITTWIWGVFVFLNFGKGLLTNVNKITSKEVESNQPIHEKRITIED